jgi:glycosyltransferase involved in cell wall biosynthesis
MLFDGLMGFKLWVYKIFWYKLPFFFADVITTVSDSSKQDLLNIFPEISKKLIVVPPMFNSQFKRMDKIFDVCCPKILIIGTSHNKNLRRVLEAIVGLKVHINIVGPLDVDIFSPLDSLSYNLHTNISSKELLHLYYSTDIVCVCSTREGFGLTIVESQMVGRPVITSNCSSMPEVAGTGAVFVDPYSINEIRNGIERVIMDANLRENIVAAGFDNVKRFENSVVFEQYYTIYGKLIGKT